LSTLKKIPLITSDKNNKNNKDKPINIHVHT
jgi:hypothetical protein